MKHFCITILVISFFHTCKSPESGDESSSRKDSNEVAYSFEESPVDFVIENSAGFSLYFYREKGNTFYHSCRFKTPDDLAILENGTSELAKLWTVAKKQIEIRLKSINVGYPLEYNDILTNQIEAFSSSASWRSQLTKADTEVDYKLVEEIMLKNNIYPLDDLLKNWGYRITDVNVEKVGFVQPGRLVGLGFDESLNIPVPYMVWLLVEETK